MIDDKEIKGIQKRMQESLRSIQKLAPLVGIARQVKEFSSDQRKNALAAEQIKFIHKGESVAASEILARSSEAYIEKFKALESGYAHACGVIAEWESVFARLDACRSMLAMSRETLRTLEG